MSTADIRIQLYGAEARKELKMSTVLVLSVKMAMWRGIGCVSEGMDCTAYSQGFEEEDRTQRCVWREL